MALASISAYLHRKWVFKQLNTYIQEVHNILVEYVRSVLLIALENSALLLTCRV